MNLLCNIMPNTHIGFELTKRCASLFISQLVYEASPTCSKVMDGTHQSPHDNIQKSEPAKLEIIVSLGYCAWRTPLHPKFEDKNIDPCRGSQELMQLVWIVTYTAVHATIWFNGPSLAELGRCEVR